MHKLMMRVYFNTSKNGTSFIRIADDANSQRFLKFLDEHYAACDYTSFDIVKCVTVDSEKYPTSAQYDLEVVVAAISIVKYLLTGRALIFDAHILPTVTDNGHYA